MAIGPATDAEVTLQEGYAFPAKVQPGGDLGFSWRVDNAGPTKATGIEVTVELPDKVSLHPKYKEALDEKAIVKVGDNTYRFKAADLDPEEDGETVPLMTVVDKDASGKLTATATVTAANIADPAAPLDAWADVASEQDGGSKWDSSRDGALWGAILGALIAGLFVWLFRVLPGGGMGNPIRGMRKNRRNRRRKTKLTTLGLEGRSGTAPPKAGAQITMTWTVKNTGSNETRAPVSATITAPLGLTVKKAEATKGTATRLGRREVLYRPGSLGKGQSAEVKITAVVDDDPPAAIPVAGIATASNVVAPGLYTLNLRPRHVVKLRLPGGKATPAQVGVGEDVTFEWKLTNGGPSTARRPKLTVTVPKGLDKPTVTVNGTALAVTKKGKNQLTAELADIKAKGSMTLRMKGAVTKSATKDLTASAEVAAADADPSPVRAEATAAVRTTLGVDGRILGTVTAGGKATYLWTVRNTGAVEAEDIRLTMPLLPTAQATFSESAPTATAAGGKLTWKPGRLRPKRATSVIAVFDVDADQSGGKLGPVQAEATAGNAGQARSATKPTADIIERSVLGITGSTGTKVTIGQQATFTWAVGNTGVSVARKVTVDFDVPDTIDGMNLTTTKGKVADGTVTIDSLPPGEGNEATITLTGVLVAQDAGPVAVKADVKEDGKEDGKALTSGTSAVVAVSDAVVKVAPVDGNPESVTAGGSATLAWSTVLFGHGRPHGAAVRLGVPDGAQVTAITVNGHAVAVPAGERNPLVPVDVTPSAPITIKATYAVADDLAARDLTFTATPVWDGAPRDTPAVCETLTVERKAALGIGMRLSHPDPACAGGSVSLVWEISNEGPSSCAEVTLAVPVIDGFVPRGATVDAIPARITESQAPRAWLIPVGPLGGGSDALVVLNVDVAADAAVGPRAPKAVVTGKDPDACNEAPGQVKVVRETVEKAIVTSAPASCTAGDPVTYAWMLENDGPSVADVEFTVVVRGDKAAVTVPPDQVVGARVTRANAATTVTWKPDRPVAPGEAHPIAFNAFTDDIAGRITVTTGLVVNGRSDEKTTDQFHTTVISARAAAV
nr:DUF11 domain-containing protein [Nocardiopsis mwathae]